MDSIEHALTDDPSDDLDADVEARVNANTMERFMMYYRDYLNWFGQYMRWLFFDEAFVGYLPPDPRRIFRSYWERRLNHNAELPPDVDE